MMDWQQIFPRGSSFLCSIKPTIVQKLERCLGGISIGGDLVVFDSNNKCSHSVSVLEIYNSMYRNKYVSAQMLRKSSKQP